MDGSTNAREGCFCKSKSGKQDDKIGHQGLHHGRSDPHTDVLIFYANGTQDIHMVSNASVSRLNDFLWDPNFMLLSMRSLLMMVGPKTHMVDLDVGKMFYNFRLSLVMGCSSSR